MNNCSSANDPLHGFLTIRSPLRNSAGDVCRRIFGYLRSWQIHTDMSIWIFVLCPRAISDSGMIYFTKQWQMMLSDIFVVHALGPTFYRCFKTQNITVAGGLATYHSRIVLTGVHEFKRRRRWESIPVKQPNIAGEFPLTAHRFASIYLVVTNQSHPSSSSEVHLRITA
jgi:hypothetical protein